MANNTRIIKAGTHPEGYPGQVSTLYALALLRAAAAGKIATVNFAEYLFHALR